MALLSFQAGVNVILSSKPLTALLGFALFVIIIIPLLKLFEKLLLILVKHTETTADDELADRLNPTAIWFVSFWALRYAYRYSGVIQSFSTKIMAVLDTALIVIIFYGVYVFLDVVIDHAGKRIASKTKSTADDNLVSLAQKSVKFLIIVFALLAIFSSWGFNITSVLAGMGIAGLALGLALQATLSNVFGGISLIMDHTYRVGDKIKIDTGEVGVVKDIGLRSTKIRDYDNKEIVIPNGVMANAKIINYVKPTKKIKLKVKFGVAYGSNIAQVKKVVLKTLKGMKQIREDPAPSVIFNEMADSSLNFTAMAWIDDYKDEFLSTEEATCKIYDALNNSKIEIPFPQMDVHVKK
ncbi:MAG: mechanosensitive ion channel family protein [Nanoarchaeota archaeon]|nr:mechanosensitive ion channel family protein [Nanoarchaeota archaeon]